MDNTCYTRTASPEELERLLQPLKQKYAGNRLHDGVNKQADNDAAAVSWRRYQKAFLADHNIGKKTKPLNKALSPKRH